MAKSFKLTVVTPERLFYEGEAELVVVRTASGEEGFMANHAWACKLLTSGEMRIRLAEDGSEKKAALSGGFIDVKDEVIIFADAAEWPDEIDVERARRAMERAEHRLREHNRTNAEIQRSKIAIARALNRIHVAGGK